MTERSDAELLEAVRGGDADALEALLRRHQDRIFRFGMRMCRDREDAREVLQDTMLAVARSAERFRGDSSFASWLFAIARNACAKRRRRSADEPESLEPLEATQHMEAASGPERDLEQRRLERALEDAIAALEPSYREVVVLRDVEGLSAKEVAAATGLSVAAVKSRLHRARVELRARLQPQLANEPDASRPDNTCPDVLRALSEHTEGDLEPSACRTLEEHVASCPHCAARCETLREVLAVCATLPPGPVPDAIAASVRTAVRGALKSAG